MAWLHRIAEIQGRAAQFLIDDQFRIAAPVRDLPRLAWFGVYCQRDPGTSFWDPDETASLNAVEDALIRLWQEFGRGFAVYVMRIATRGIREYYVYLGGAADFSPVLSRLQSEHPNYRVEYEEHADPDWKRYISCLPVA